MSARGPAISRRAFIATSGGIGFAVALGASPLGRAFAAGAGDAGARAIGAWVRIEPDGTVIIYSAAAEMGQGSMTSLPVILAEEMDADWARVRLEPAPVDAAVYGNPRFFGGSMLTVGSRSVMGYYQALRHAGAQVHRVLLEMAAGELGVPVASLTTEPGTIVHAASGRRLGYGDVARTGTLPAHAPRITDADLKARRDFRLIGRSVPRRDIPAKVDGEAIFALDVRLPGMVHAAMRRSPVNGTRPVESNAETVRKRPGVIDLVEFSHGIAVVARTMEEALAARAALEIRWSEDAPARTFDSEAALESYRGIAADPGARSASLVRRGDVDAALARAAKRYSTEYLNDHAYHAQMEPLNAVVAPDPDGKGARVWVGTQFIDGARDAAAEALGLARERVRLHACYVGGGFGRRSANDNVVEAALIAKVVRRPVKLLWTREDDIHYGRFRPMALQRLEAGLDAAGNVVAWRHVVVGEGGGLLASGIRIPWYAVANQDIVLKGVNHGLRLQPWRAVGHGFNKFAIESFVDELAATRKEDPYAFRRRLMRGFPRALAVLDAAASMAGWGEPRAAGRALGLAFAERSDSLAAGVAEISVDRAKGRVRVHRFWAALDAGVVVQPDNAIAQMEGGIVHGLSAAAAERVTFRGGAVQQSNFDDYPLLRMADAPEEIQVRIVDSGEPPTGVGEVGVPITAGAVANAVAALTGARLRHLPFTPERVKAALPG